MGSTLENLSELKLSKNDQSIMVFLLNYECSSFLSFFFHSVI